MFAAKITQFLIDVTGEIALFISKKTRFTYEFYKAVETTDIIGMILPVRSRQHSGVLQKRVKVDLDTTGKQTISGSTSEENEAISFLFRVNVDKPMDIFRAWLKNNGRDGREI